MLTRASPTHTHLSKGLKYSFQHLLCDVEVKGSHIQPHGPHIDGSVAGKDGWGHGHAILLSLRRLHKDRNTQKFLTSQTHCQWHRLSVLELNVSNAFGATRFIVSD